MKTQTPLKKSQATAIGYIPDSDFVCLAPPIAYFAQLWRVYAGVPMTSIHQRIIFNK